MKMKAQMNRTTATVALGVALTGLAVMTADAQEEEFVPDNEVRQINTVVIDEVEYKTILSINSPKDVGEEAVPLPLPFGVEGALFELWADEEGAAPVLVDTKKVSGYSPKATFVVESDDPWRGVVVDEENGVTIEIDKYRTRADHFYDVSVHTEGLLTDASLPQFAREVLVSHTMRVKNSIDYSFGSNVEIEKSDPLVLDVSHPNFNPDGPEGPSLPGFADVLQMVGEEYLTVSAHPEPGGDEWTVGRATIMIWPLMSGSFYQMGENGQESFSVGQDFDDQVRNIFVYYKNIYPASFAYVQIYKGPYNEGISGFPLEITKQDAFGSEVAQNTTKEGGYKIDNDTLQPYIQRWGDGEYTLEIINAGLPFEGEEVQTVNHITFTVSRGIRVKGQIGTAK